MSKDGKTETFPNGQAIQKQYNNEKQAISDDRSALQKTEKQVENNINSLKQQIKNTKDPSQKAFLQKQLSQQENYLKGIPIALAHLTNLQNDLKYLKITVGKDGKATLSVAKGAPQGLTLNKVLANISRDEGQVINGSGTPPMGGLTQIYDQIHGDLQDYTNQSQSQQMKLQLTMTAIQQEWSTVGSSMTTFNMAMMSLAQSIYK